MKTKTPRMILMGAAWYLKQHGWQKGNLGKDGGPRCIFGALLSAAEVTNRKYQAGTGSPVDLAAVALRRTLPLWRGQPRIYEYNDLVCKDADEAIKVLEWAADTIT